MKLSDHFTLQEFHIPEDAPVRLIETARFIAQYILEPVRAHFESPVTITSAYRPPEKNAEVSDKQTSYHLFDERKDGQLDYWVGAVDITVKDIHPRLVFDFMRIDKSLPYQKVILECDPKDRLARCVHIQVRCGCAPLKRRAFVGSTGKAHDYVEVSCA